MEGICGIEGELKLYFDVLDKVRTAVDKLDTAIEIPQIAVIGNQSVGKSSVLELISGVRLPQGNDIVTRCPIMLQIRRATKSSIELNGESLAKSQMADKLNAAQDKVIKQFCSKARNEVTARPVILNMCGPELRDLTLVDLPGIQYSEDGLKNSIVSMIETYISSPATIILLINNCTSDPTATEALSLARKHDPNQERTVCILTKPDEIKDDDVEKKEALMKLVKGQHAQLHFKCGAFIVKGRQSNHGNLTIEQVRELEADYFRSQSVFDKCLDMGKAGSTQLTKSIEKLALEKMKNETPRIRKEMIKALRCKKDELDNFPTDLLPVGSTKKYRILTQTINEIIIEFKNSLENELGQRVKLLFEMMQVKILNLLRNESRKDEIIQDIMNCGALNPHGFASTDKFKHLFQLNLKQVTAVTENTIFEVQVEVEHLIDLIASEKGNTLELEQEFSTVTSDVFRENVTQLMSLYGELIEAEMMPYLPDFMEFFFEGEKQLAKIPKAFTLHGAVPGCNEIPDSLMSTAVDDNSFENEAFKDGIDSRTDINHTESIEENENLKNEDKKKKTVKKSKMDIFSKFINEDSTPTTANPKFKHVKQLKINDVSSGNNKFIRDAKAKKYLEGKLVYEAYRTYLYHTSTTLLMTVPKLICHHLFIRFPDDLQKTMLSMLTEFAHNMSENTEAKIRYDNLVDVVANLEEALDQFRKLSFNI